MPDKPNDLNFYDQLLEADKLSTDNLAGAIEIIEALRPNKNFYPWGALALAKFYINCGDINNAKLLNDEICKKFPGFIPGISQRMRLYRSNNGFNGLLTDLFREIQKLDSIKEKWFLNDYLEIIFFNAQLDCESLIHIGLEGGILDDNLADGVRSLLPFLADIRKALIVKSPTNFSSWSLLFLGSSEEAVRCDSDGLLAVNMSRMRLRHLAGWEKKVAKPLIMSLVALIGSGKSYLVDGGNISLPFISEADKYSVIFWRLLTSEVEQVLSGKIETYKLKVANMQPGSLWVRVGIVELWAVWNYLADRDQAYISANTVAKMLFEAAQEKQYPTVNNEWWPNTNPINNITRLALNGGWYSDPSSGGDAFFNWAQRYLDAICYGNLFDTCAHEILRVASFVPGMRRETFVLRDQIMIPMLCDANIVFCTAFADQIKDHFDSGKLGYLYADLGIEGRIGKLSTVQSPISIFPYRPDGDFSDTFSKLVADCASKIRATGASLFMASCGAYGLPLVHEIHRQFGITSIYMGHRSNIYFGVITNAFLNDSFFLRNIKSSNWLSVDLSREYSDIARIDDGRYVVCK
jgi:hypothetical protein